MKLHLVIGVEGSGHHLLRAAMKSHLAKATTVDKGDYYPLLVQRWRPGPRRLPFDLVKHELQRIVGFYSHAGVTHLYEDTSFPFGPGRSALTRPDIIDLLDLFAGICEISILLLYRSPIETTYSAFRRGFSNSLSLECLHTEASHQYIRSQLSCRPTLEFRTLDFRRFLNDRENHVAALSKWMKLPESCFDTGACDAGMPVSGSGIPADSRRQLGDFFNHDRVQQWESFYDHHSLIPSQQPIESAS